MRHTRRSTSSPSRAGSPIGGFSSGWTTLHGRASPRTSSADSPMTSSPMRSTGCPLRCTRKEASSRGVVLGARALLTRFGFGLDPFSSQMNFGAAYATGVNRPRLEYGAQFRTRSPVTGLLYLAYSGMEVLGFYGLGNETKIDQ